MRILLVDDHTLFLEGLANLLTLRGFQVVGTAQDGHAALVAARALQPDLILMDIQMPGCDGLTATRLIKSEMPEVKIVMLTVSETDQDLFEAIKSGASGYVIKNLDANRFCEMLPGLAEGEPVLSRGLAARILKEFASQANKSESVAQSELTPRQLEVLTLVADGLSYKQVGEALYLTERTVKYHMSEILKALHLKNRAQVIAYALRKGILQTPPPNSNPK